MVLNNIMLLETTAVLFAVGIATGISGVVCHSALTVREYDFPIEGIERPLTAVCITDLHGREFGQNNGKLLAEIQAQKPDVIFTLGDLISRTVGEKEVAKMCDFLHTLWEIAPVYSSFGNHEVDYMALSGKDLRPLIRDAGAYLLDEECCVATVAGNRICLGGTLGHLFAFGRSREEYLQSPEYRLLTKMQDSGLPTIVLSHRPDTIIFDKAYEDWDIDLFLSGHTHGGLIRLPLIGGLYAPKQDFFPKYDRGYFSIGKTHLLISSGFAGYGPFPRVFNRPELCVLRIR